MKVTKNAKIAFDELSAWVIAGAIAALRDLVPGLFAGDPVSVWLREATLHLARGRMDGMAGLF
jgi:hypothetical protein